MKKVFIISAILLAVVLIFLGIYNFAFKKETPTSQQVVVQKTADSTKNATLVPTRPEKITLISDGAVVGPVTDKKTEEIKYYDAATGFVWQMDGDGQKKRQIASTKILGLKSVNWSPDHSKVLTMTQKDGQSTFYMYDYTSQVGTQLKAGLDTAVWDNLGTKIFYKYYDSGSQKRSLNVSSPDGTGWQKLADITARNIVIASIPLSSTVSYWNYPNATEETQLQVVGVTGGDQKMILNGRYGADYLWSPMGEKAIASSLTSKDSKTFTLGIVGMDGNYQDLNTPTLASKCAWSEDGKTLYYALPGEIPAGAVMPNDYQEGKFKTSDTFWKMDMATGEKTRIVEVAEMKSKYDSSNLFLSPTEDALYFINRIDGKLYRIGL